MRPGPPRHRRCRAPPAAKCLRGAAPKQTAPAKHLQTPRRPPAMTSEPSPEEQKRLDAAAKANELAEQAALPYKWDQTIKDLDITVPIEAKYKGRDLDVKIAR